MKKQNLFKGIAVILAAATLSMGCSNSDIKKTDEYASEDSKTDTEDGNAPESDDTEDGNVSESDDTEDEEEKKSQKIVIDDPNFVVNEDGVLLQYKGPGGEVVIPDGVKAIGFDYLEQMEEWVEQQQSDGETGATRYVFESCKGDITSVIIPDSVERIGYGAFGYCYHLENITIPDTISYVGDEAFFNTKWASNKLAERDNTKPFIVGKVLVDASYIDADSITIPEGIKTIGHKAFYECKASEIIIPESVNSIENYAFYECKASEIIIPESVNSIGNYAFKGCKASKIIIPESVNRIGARAFNDSTWLEERRQENPLVIVNGILVDGKQATGDITIPDNVTCIGESAFSFSDTIVSVDIPDSVTKIAWHAFYCCKKLEEITIPDSVKEIEEGAFYSTAIKEITLPKKLKCLSYEVLKDCRNLVSVKLPDKLELIEKQAMDDCPLLKSVTIPKSVKEIHEDVFFSYEGKTYTIIEGTKGSYAQKWAEENQYEFKEVK